MYKFSVFLLLVSIFASNAFCMNPSDLGLPLPSAPENVQFGECFVVSEIYRGLLVTGPYNYNHICPKKYQNNEPEPPAGEKVWYVVGSLKETATSGVHSQYDYTPIEQYLIQFIFLRDTMVEFLIKESIIRVEFSVIFQSFEQFQAFYRMIYSEVNLSQVTEDKIGALHEMNIRENTKLGNNVEALHEDFDDVAYITFRNDRGEPLLIFSQNEARIERIMRSQNNKLQLMLRIHVTYYILTFSSNDKARKFSVALSKYVKKLDVTKVFPNVKARFEENQITVDS